MNVGAIVSMQNLGQLSNREKSPGLQDGDNDSLFSQLYFNELAANGSEENVDTGMIQLLELLDILQVEVIAPVEKKGLSEVNMKEMLSEAGFTEENFLVAVQSLTKGIVKEIPQLEELVSTMKGEEGEAVLVQLLEMISLLSVDTLKKLDHSSLQLLLKASKIFEQGLRQADSNNDHAEKAESLQHNLKTISQKLEQLFIVSDNKSAKWNGILKQAYEANPIIRNFETGPKNGTQLSHAVNKTQGEKITNLVHPNLLIFQSQSDDSKGESSIEVDKVKGNGGPLSMFIGQNQTTKVEQFSLFVNKNQNGPTYEQFVKEFGNILARSQMLHTPNMSKLLIKLYPERLGSLRIEILQQNGVMTARILASTNAAKDILDSQLTGLRQALSSQNLQVEKIEVAHTLTDSTRQERQTSQQQQNGQQQREQSTPQHNENDHPETGFKELLMNSEE
ncbi:flagellar hook-length control protein FliK [Rossellomorea vietnamensis]|uniref:Flagellar hook-length control protein FliK n=1 Tax=Rossellomorea vietnamensis TaxID=218284 RepID=A0A5D4KMG2_9BACI|nr:flagellar hook-length control protein FliK [Rossellomorea vietnamensis]TYR77523.1 flagellar hook-length control protein FliK [Rossellomorea vietnamensis]